WNNVQDLLPAALSRSLGDWMTPPRMLVDSGASYRNSQFYFRQEEPFVIVQAGTKPEDATYYRAPVPTGAEAWPTGATVERQFAPRYAMVAGLPAAAPFSPFSLATAHQWEKVSGGKAPRSHVQSLEAPTLAANPTQGFAGLLAYPPRL